jgi:hypothetical protein
MNFSQEHPILPQIPLAQETHYDNTVSLIMLIGGIFCFFLSGCLGFFGQVLKFYRLKKKSQQDVPSEDMCAVCACHVQTL